MSKKDNLKTLDQFIEEEFGPEGTPDRQAFEKGYEAFKIGFLIQQARIKKRNDSRRTRRKMRNQQGLHFKDRK